MEFSGVKLLNIDQLGLSQLYLSAQKLAAVAEWLQPQSMERFQPLPVHDFGNGIYTLTDGHTRAYMAYQRGILAVPAVYDTDEMVTSPIGKMQYQADIDWCKRFQVSHIKQLQNRVLNESQYQKLWIERCDRSYHLIVRTSHAEREQLQNLAPHLFLYGASEDLSVLFFENAAGELFFYKNRTLTPEGQIENRP